MKLKYILMIFLLCSLYSFRIHAQNISSSTNNISIKDSTNQSKIYKNPAPKEPVNKWSLNLIFSDNGFGLGATIFKQFNEDLSGFSSIFFTGAKDSKEFDVTDIYGNSYTPFKVNRLFMIPLNFGLQYRMFREDVTDNLRPYVNGGITPTTIIYTPYNVAFIPSFGKAQAKYTVGAFFGVGMDYLPSRKTGLSLNVRYYYIHLFGNGIQSLQDKPINEFGGLYFVFSFNFMQ